MRRRLIVGGMAALLLAFVATAFQWNSDNIKKEKKRDKNHRDVIGMVTLPDDQPASGAVVKLKNLHSLEVHSFITQADGKYVFQHLNSNMDYELRADFKDLASPARKLLVYDTRLDPVINLKLEPVKKPAAGQPDEKAPEEKK
ncbi:MAG: carboxypeptidase-like regulatory domain-containing protein [Bryobacteraceae bacterium]